MTRLGRAGALLLALALVLGGAGVARAGDDGWLLGRWELIHDPAGGPKDWLEFGAGGRLTAIAPTGERFGGRYAVTGTEIHLDYKAGSQSILITLAYGPDRARLYARSPRTGYTAVYEKRPVASFPAPSQ